MFAHLVTAARGLFTSSESSRNSNDATQDTESAEATMVTATRRSILSQADLPSRNASPDANGKRKSSSVATEVVLEPTPKRRRAQSKEETDSQSSFPPSNQVPQKRYVLEAVEIISSRSATRESSILTPTTATIPEQKLPIRSPKPTSGHVRFGSEEPLPTFDAIQRDSENKAVDPPESLQQEEEGEEESDDEAPEAVSNTQKLNELKEAERKREEAKQRQERVKREKRQEHEKRLKLQAKQKLPSQPSIPATQPKTSSKQEEVLSESSVTLQGSDSKTTGSSFTIPASLPKFLPDEILFAKPSVRPPTPPRHLQDQPAVQNPAKIRFSDTVEKKPKDAKIGDTSIRVLEKSRVAASQNRAHHGLPPKAMKSSRSVRDSWIAGHHKKPTTSSNGLRRTTGGVSGFLRQ